MIGGAQETTMSRVDREVEGRWNAERSWLATDVSVPRKFSCQDR